MYNGIGLSTARGSGTNGYVQRNLALIRSGKNKIDFRTEEELLKLEAQTTKGPNADILAHARKRALELKCAEMEDVMREQGYDEREVEEKVEVFRAMLMEREQAASRANDIPKDKFGRPNVRETHAVAEAQQEKNSRLKEAFGISEYFVEGSSLDPNRRAKEEVARAAAEKQQKATASAEGQGPEGAGKKYSWVHTPSPSPERSSSKKDKKDKKKKKKRSRDRSSSIESRKKHKSKKAKRSRSKSPKRKKRDKKKKKEKAKRRHRSSSTSSSSSSSTSSTSSSSGSDSGVRSKSRRRRSRSPVARDSSEYRRKRSRSRERSRKRTHHHAER